MKSWTTVFPKQSFQGVTVFCKGNNYLTVFCGACFFDQNEIVFLNSNIDHRISVCAKQEAFTVYPIFRDSQITDDMLFLFIGRTAYDLSDDRDPFESASHFTLKLGFQGVFAGVGNKSSFFQLKNISVCGGTRHTHIFHNFRKAWRSAVVISCILIDISGKSFYFFLIHCSHLRSPLTNCRTVISL